MMQIQKCVKPEIKGLSIIGRFRNRNKWYKKTETARKRKSPVRLAGVRKIGPQIARTHVGWGGGLLPGCEASGVERSPTPDCPPSGRAAGAHYPVAVGAGGCGRGDPSETPQHALLRAVGAA